MTHIFAICYPSKSISICVAASAVTKLNLTDYFHWLEWVLLSTLEAVAGEIGYLPVSLWSRVKVNSYHSYY